MKQILLILTLALAPLAFGQAPSSTVSSTTYEASHVVKTGRGDLVLLMGYNSGGTQFIQVHDAAALPAEGATPALVFTVPAGDNFSLAIPNQGMHFMNGITICNSSTANTKTIGGADCYFTAVVR